MDKDEGIRTLWEWFEDRTFKIKDMSNEKVQKIARLVEANGPTPHGRRVQLGKCLTAMVGYKCSTAPNLGATLTAARNPVDVDPSPETYRIQQD